MYELSRVRLHAVGPPGARYQDVLLDLSGAGPVVDRQQTSLLGPDEPVRRPAPASVLFLENGGGKSVLIKLIFSVMLPGRRQVVGTTSTRVLEKFVMARDVSHVVVEWMHTETGQRLVTGKVSEWRGRVLSSDPANLVDSWYCFRPGDGMDLDRLPLTEDTQLLSMSAFRDRLGDAHAADPGLELSWTRRHNEWTDRLDAVGLDPELFRYQRAMNAGEGEAADAFAFGTDEAFVEFLLRAVLSEDDPNDLAEVLGTYAENLAQRGELTVERDFVAGALDLLGPLASAEALAAASRDLAAKARVELESFARQVAARDGHETEHLAAVQEHAGQLAEAERLAEGDHRRRAAVVAELRRLVATLRLDEAVTERDAASTELELARTQAAAWRETGTVLARLNTAGTASRLRELVGTKEEKARPALAAKNAAATALARGLLGLAAEATAQAATEQELAGSRAAEAQAAQTAQNQATTAAATAKATADQLAERLAEVRTLVAAAVRDGLLESGTGAAEVTVAAVRAAEQVESATVELTRVEGEAERLDEEYGQAQTAVHEAHRAAETARSRQERAAAELNRANTRTDSLAAEPRLVELLDSAEATDSTDSTDGSGGVRLETDCPALLNLLADASADAERVRIELRVAEASDRQARLALDNGELLPPPAEVGAVTAALEAAGITSQSGWEYLTNLTDTAARERLVRRVPQLASGVLLNGPEQVRRAREVLAGSTLRPSTFVAIGTTAAALDEQTGLGGGVDFVVPPNPALYDPEAAAVEQAAIAGRHAERQRRLAALEESLRADTELAGRLTAWRAEYPPGRIATLAEQSETASRELTEAEARATTRAGEQETLRLRRAAVRERLPGLRESLRGLERRSRGLDQLAQRAARVPEWTEAAERAAETLTLEQARIAEAEQAAARLRAEAAEHQRSADAHKGTADRARAELAEVPGGGAVAEDDPVPGEPVDALRRTFRSAADAYAKVEVGSDLRAELDQAESAEAAARAAVEVLDPRVRELATSLLDSPDGSDAAARAAAGERAGRAVEAAEQRRSAAIDSVASRRAALEQLPAQTGLVDDFEQPRDVRHGRELLERANGELSAAARELEEKQRLRAEADRALDTARGSTDSFRLLVESMAIPVPEGETDRAYDGDAASARERYARLNSEWNTAQSVAGSADERVRTAADELAQYASEKRFDKLGTPVRRQIVSVRRANLPDHAAEWAEALRPRLRTLTDDLAQIDRHRSGIITRLQGMVDGALRTLRSAQRVSRLPEGLGDWSGQEFLRIAFTALEDNLLAERLGEVVDEAAAGRTSDGREVKRDGMSLLLRGVLAAAPKGFRVDMLKPDSVLRTERQRVPEIRDVFSGGQQLTAAIILYCTMAALRANNRGRVRNRHSGVLFLDNPIGRASAGYLLELQRAVATALGVQLIYTTGLFDAGALSEFPLIVRLRNDADLRAGRKYLSVDDTIRHQLEQLPESDGVARISATRVFVHEEDTEVPDAATRTTAVSSAVTQPLN